MKVTEVSMEQRRNVRAGETGDLRENAPTSGIVRHDSHVRKSWTRRFTRLLINHAATNQRERTRVESQSSRENGAGGGGVGRGNRGVNSASDQRIVLSVGRVPQAVGASADCERGLKSMTRVNNSVAAGTQCDPSPRAAITERSVGHRSTARGYRYIEHVGPESETSALRCGLAGSCATFGHKSTDLQTRPFVRNRDQCAWHIGDMSCPGISSRARNCHRSPRAPIHATHPWCTTGASHNASRQSTHVEGREEWTGLRGLSAIAEGRGQLVNLVQRPQGPARIVFTSPIERSRIRLNRVVIHDFTASEWITLQTTSHRSLHGTPRIGDVFTPEGHPKKIIREPATSNFLPAFTFPRAVWGSSVESTEQRRITRGGGNATSPRKPTHYCHRPAQFSRAKIRVTTSPGIEPESSLVGREGSSHSITAAPCFSNLEDRATLKRQDNDAAGQQSVEWRRKLPARVKSADSEHRDTHMLHCDFFTFPSVRRRAAAWYILHAIGFLVDHSKPVTVQDFVQLLRQDRWNMARRGTLRQWQTPHSASVGCSVLEQRVLCLRYCATGRRSCKGVITALCKSVLSVEMQSESVPKQTAPYAASVLYNYLTRCDAADEDEMRWNWSSAGMRGAGETGFTRENPSTSSIGRHDSHLRKFQGDPAGDRARFASVGGGRDLETASHRGPGQQ
ncbi:hypothetical protein PR048_026042 [Dryococelus australis]|uniref:Uncharacterized protein n=1 Tax=Dryococelus australis TaxID=614101 RepID=A0ABQ9GK98_9NEOP|nr:hypothetical protein PR048_026042 [Dryococelus australis]